MLMARTDVTLSGKGIPQPLRIAVVAVVSALAASAIPSPSALAGGRPLGLEERPVTATDIRLRAANNSPSVLVDPTQPRFAVIASRLDAPAFGCALSVSGDAGRTWLPASPVPKLPPGAETCYAPEIAFDRSGRLYYLFVGLAGAGNSPMGVFLTTSSDRGRTFTAPRQVLGAERYQVRMAVDRSRDGGGRLHLVWLQAGAAPPLGGLPPPPNPLMSAYSDDGGKTFSRPVQVNDPDRLRAVAPALALGPGNRVYVLYYDLQDDFRDYQGLEGPTWEGNWSLVLARSTDGGRRFDPGVVVDDGLVPPERVMLIYTMPPPALVTGKDGALFASWYDARNGDWDVFVRRSLDGGRSWSTPTRLNDDPVGNGRHQYLPRLSVAPSGRLDAVFYDRRWDPDNRDNHVVYAYSTDGRRFSRNLRLTADGSDTKIGQQYTVPSAAGMVEFGSRLGLVSDRSRVLAAWTDTRNSSVGTSAQDVFSTVVTGLPAPSRPPLWRRILVPALGALGVGGAALLFRFGRRRRRRAESAADEELQEEER